MSRAPNVMRIATTTGVAAVMRMVNEVWKRAAPNANRTIPVVTPKITAIPTNDFARSPSLSA